jgi:hypothetical protein
MAGCWLSSLNPLMEILLDHHLLELKYLTTSSYAIITVVERALQL